MKISMLFGGLFYAFRGIVILFPFALTAVLGMLSIHSSFSGATITTEEPIWALAVASVLMAFIEEHYFREREYEAFAISLVGTSLIVGIAVLFYTSDIGLLPYLAYSLFAFGIIDFALGFEYHKPGHRGRMKKRDRSASD
jgi:hypothetical protein